MTTVFGLLPLATDFCRCLNTTGELDMITTFFILPPSDLLSSRISFSIFLFYFYLPGRTHQNSMLYYYYYHLLMWLFRRL